MYYRARKFSHARPMWHTVRGAILRAGRATDDRVCLAMDIRGRQPLPLQLCEPDRAGLLRNDLLGRAGIPPPLLDGDERGRMRKHGRFRQGEAHVFAHDYTAQQQQHARTHTHGCTQHSKHNTAHRRTTHHQACAAPAHAPLPHHAPPQIVWCFGPKFMHPLCIH